MPKRLKTLLISICCLLSINLSCLPAAFAETIPDNEITSLDYKQLSSNRVTRPSSIAMGADVIIARPLLLAATAIGVGLFVVSLPLSILGNNVNEAGHKLVGVPAKATFFRCLGCPMSDNA